MCEFNGKGCYLLCGFCERGRNLCEIVTRCEWVEQRYVGHPTLEVSIVNPTDGLDRRLHGGWWDKYNGCGMGFVWHIVNR